MEKIYDMHAHYSLDNTLKETVELFKKEFDITHLSKYAFLSMPHHAINNKLTFDYLQNVKGLFLKYVFSPNAYAYAGLEHPLVDIDSAKRSDLYLKQVEEYFLNGFDGIKMIEGYPSMRKTMKIPLCDEVYDKYYSFLEENNIPVTMHCANPVENWDISKVDTYALKVGRYCDSTYPTKQQLFDEVIEIMRKHPKLRLCLAHFGFLTYDINEARRFLDDYPNTLFDTTPGGEQFINIMNNWREWNKFFIDYQERIVYGSDLYAIPPKDAKDDEEWLDAVVSRTKFQEKFFSTKEEFAYDGKIYNGIQLDERIVSKIYYENSQKLFGEPKAINKEYIIEKTMRYLETEKTKELREELSFILNSLSANNN